MATYLTQSVSESFHASLIAQHKNQFKHDYDETKQSAPTDRHNKYGERDHCTQTISICSQVLLTVAFVGIEMTASFTVIYNVLFLQFLGVPTSLVSVGGVICGATAFVLLPIIGWFSDRGSNPVIRKGLMMLIGYSAYAVGLFLLSLCSVWKLYPDGLQKINSTSSFAYGQFQNVSLDKQIENERFLNSATFNPNIQTNLNYHLTKEGLRNTTTTYYYPNDIILDPKIDSDNNDNESPASLSTTGLAGILAFALLDIAFDSCTSLCRAFVLECSPPAMHSRLLVMSTAFGSVFGCLISFVGAFDIPGSLGPMLQVDGTAATVLMFSCVIFLIVTSSFACTLITGYKLSKKNINLKEKAYSSTDDHESMNSSNTSQFDKPWSRSSSKTKISSEDLFQPLLSNENSGKEYFSISKQNENSSINEKNQLFSGRLTENEGNSLYENKVLNLDVTLRRDNCVDNDPDDNNIDRDNQNEFCISQSGSEHDSFQRDTEEGTMNEKDNRRTFGISSFVSTVLNSYSVSMSNAPISLIGDNFQLRKNDRKYPNVKSTTLRERPLWKNKRLMILCLSMFFTMGGLLTFSQYAGNTLTIGIYHGDPTGQEGTPGRDLYNKGLRRAALGFLVCFLVYMTVSVFNKKIIDLIGEKSQYIACQIALVAVNVTLVLVQTEEWYFVTCAVSGFYRACGFTLAYVMANKFVQEDNASRGGESNRSSGSVGRVMVMIGMMLPASYLLASSFMGPLMGALDNPWVPTIYGGFCAAMSLLSFCLLFLVKP